MRKMNVMSLLLLMAAQPLYAQNKAALYDSTEVERLQEVVVTGVRAQKNAPYAISNLKKKELNDFSKTGRELPFLFSQTPGVMAWSENGMGIGTTHLRIRGAGDSRINVTLDGVPLNSPEDQCVFWANMNSYASLLGSVQIQRGVGTSTNGDGAFGGTIALSSATPLLTPSIEVTGSYGTYSTWNVGGNFSSGLLGKHWVIDGAYHETHTNGFMHGTKARSGSYYGGITYMGERFQIRYKNIGNFEKTGQAWNGATAGDDYVSLMDGIYGVKTGIKTYEDMWNAGLGRYNSLYEHLVKTDPTDSYSGFVQDANGKYVTERYQLADGSYWDRTFDYFKQNHNILSGSWDINEHWTTTASLHYTYGHGYYEEFRPNNKLKKYGLVLRDVEGNKIKSTDFIRQKGLTQHTYGVLWNINYKNDHWDVIGGFSLQNFDGTHFGYLTYAKNPDVVRQILQNGKYKYYDSDAHKFDVNGYLKAAYHINSHWDVFADVQYRYVNYRSDGYNDKYMEDETTGEMLKHYIDINEKYHFFNPKAGFSWKSNGHRVYGSIAMSHREPERNNFTDNGSYGFPESERLLDYELGYTYNARSWRVGVNLYYMDYKDQLVQTGALSDIGENLTTNIEDSYRMGMELQAGWDITPWLTIEGNAALSKNKIKDFDEVVEDWDNGSQIIHYDNSTLAFSPSVLLNGFINLHWKGWQAVWHTNYVSRQYLDNTANEDRSLPGYSVTSLNLSYTLPCKRWMGLKETVFALNMNNLFNKHYASGGWVYSAIYESGGHPNDNRYYQIGFIPMAGFTMMGSVTLRF